MKSKRTSRKSEGGERRKETHLTNKTHFYPLFFDFYQRKRLEEKKNRLQTKPTFTHSIVVSDDAFSGDMPLPGVYLDGDDFLE